MQRKNLSFRKSLGTYVHVDNAVVSLVRMCNKMSLMFDDGYFYA